MIAKEINNTLILVWNHKFARISFLLITFTCLLLSIFFSIFSSVVIIISYFWGSVVGFCLVKYRFQVNFCLHRIVNYYNHRNASKIGYNSSCNICDNLNCNRHQNTPIKEPWKDLFISEELNIAIENFFNKIIENYINTWYSSFTDDPSFINELRSSIRYAISCLIQRYLLLNIGHTISNKLLPCIVRHIDDCIQIQKKSDEENLKIKTAAVNFLGCRLHSAVTNRNNELNYLRNLIDNILPKIAPKSQLKCRSSNILIREIISGWVFLPLMDIIADPNTFNYLVNTTIIYKRKNDDYHIFERVEFLYNFVNYKNIKKAALGFELTKIFKQPECLYAFMQFLKEEGPVNLLQFCMDCEEFNRKLLTPDLSLKDLENLYSEATQICNLYLREDSKDFIGCSKDVSANFESILCEGSSNIDKLRTSTPLYKAYDFAFNILEVQWLPIFFHSDKFYSVACGSKISSNYNKSPVNRVPKKLENISGPVSKFSSSLNKIKSTLRNQPIEGSVLNEPINFESEEPNMYVEEPIYRDLSTWRISITHSEQMQSSKLVSLFYINVRRIDSCLDTERSWTVQRQDQDFYTLKIKLVEFHGENEICESPLPNRRLSTTSESRRRKYEEFLQKLLQKNTLRGSDLLYTFLTTKENFTLLADTSVPIVSDLENIYLSVAHKLRKEKGQHLENFMKSFLSSTETIENKNPDIGEEADTELIFEKSTNTPRNIENTIFENNFGIKITQSLDFSPLLFNPQDIIECFYYLLRNIFHAPKGFLQLFTSVCSISSQSIQTLSKYFIEKQLKNTLSEHTLARLITLLRETLLEHKLEPSTPEELELRKINAFNNLSKLNPGYFCNISGLEINVGLTTLLKILQNPQLNKQLAYSILDIVMLELFPDCNLT